MATNRAKRKRKTAKRAVRKPRATAKRKAPARRKAAARRAASAARRPSSTQQVLDLEPLETPQLANLEAEQYDGLERG